MAQKTRELHRSADAMAMNEDSWHLVFDDEDNRLFVLHTWDYHDPKSQNSDNGTEEIAVDELLNEGGEGNQHRELKRLLSSMFEGT